MNLLSGGTDVNYNAACDDTPRLVLSNTPKHCCKSHHAHPDKRQRERQGSHDESLISDSVAGEQDIDLQQVQIIGDRSSFDSNDKQCIQLRSFAHAKYTGSSPDSTGKQCAVMQQLGSLWDDSSTTDSEQLSHHLTSGTKDSTGLKMPSNVGFNNIASGKLKPTCGLLKKGPSKDGSKECDVKCEYMYHMMRMKEAEIKLMKKKIEHEMQIRKAEYELQKMKTDHDMKMREAELELKKQMLSQTMDVTQDWIV